MLNVKDVKHLWKKNFFNKFFIKITNLTYWNFWLNKNYKNLIKNVVIIQRNSVVLRQYFHVIDYKQQQ